METGETYTMSYVATSTCNEDVAIGFYGYNGWLTSVVGARVVGRAVETMDEALRWCWNASAEGDRILLSPGCSSFDQFADYEQRGAKFRRAVDEIRRKSDIRSGL